MAPREDSTQAGTRENAIGVTATSALTHIKKRQAVRMTPRAPKDTQTNSARPSVPKSAGVIRLDIALPGQVGDGADIQVRDLLGIAHLAAGNEALLQIDLTVERIPAIDDHFAECRAKIGVFIAAGIPFVRGVRFVWRGRHAAEL